AGMKLADPARGLAIEVYPRAAARMEGGMGRRLALHPVRHERLEIALEIEEIDRARRQAPLLFARRSVGERRQPHRLVDAGNRERPSWRGLVGPEYPPGFEQAYPRGLAVQV